MKFLIHANAPTVPTGYGVQCKHLATMLSAAGHEVAVSCTYGHQVGVSTWTTPMGHKVRLYPSGYEVNSNDVIHGHADHFFEGDKLGGWIITLVDVWALTNPLLAEYQVASWAPIDHFPMPRDVARFFERSRAVPVAMAQYGQRQMLSAGLDPAYVPLCVDTGTFKPTPTVDVAGQQVDARTLYKLPHNAFVVGMVAMNKGWARDRKGFHEAFRAFGLFWQKHNDAVLFMHSEQLGGAEGINLVELAQHCGIPTHALVWVDQYAYRIGLPSEMLAAAYTAMDVLLAPSHGEGFCVPLIEAQACGVPVIASDFSAQSELVGAGWLLTGQPEWDPAQHASYVVPFVDDVVSKLEAAYSADLPAMAPQARAFAEAYDVRQVWEDHWLPFLATLEPEPTPEPRPIMERCAVIVPAMRAENVRTLAQSFEATAPEAATLYVVADAGATDVHQVAQEAGAALLLMTEEGTTTYGQKVNRAAASVAEDWLLIVGDDCTFEPGWFEAAQPLTERYDLVGTNDSEPGRVRNPDVASGTHADHFFVRASYVAEQGASLDGPGLVAPEVYAHWFVDREIIGLARARSVFAPCLESRVIHHHPGYEGDESARAADATYMAAVQSSAQDRATFLSRVGLIEAQRVSRARLR